MTAEQNGPEAVALLDKLRFSTPDDCVAWRVPENHRRECRHPAGGPGRRIGGNSRRHAVSFVSSDALALHGHRPENSFP
jgi:hypothetical protein